jgi:hypothetical protein
MQKAEYRFMPAGYDTVSTQAQHTSQYSNYSAAGKMTTSTASPHSTDRTGVGIPTGGFTTEPGTDAYGRSPHSNDAYSQGPDGNNIGGYHGAAGAAGSYGGSAQNGGTGTYGGSSRQSHFSETDMWINTAVPVPNVPTMMAPDKKGRLENALDNLAMSGQPFLGRFTLLSAANRRQGGQGIVQVCALPGNVRCKV